MKKAQGSTLDLKTFKSICDFESLTHDGDNLAVIVNTCIRTAEDLGANITVKKELLEAIAKEEKHLLKGPDPLATKRLQRLRHLHHLLPC